MSTSFGPARKALGVAGKLPSNSQTIYYRHSGIGGKTRSEIKRTAQERVIRVFVSSTFRDMQAERDHLVKIIFPHLRKLCAERGVV